MKLKNWGMGGYCPRGAIVQGAIVRGAIVRGAIVLDPNKIYSINKMSNIIKMTIIYGFRKKKNQ